MDGDNTASPPRRQWIAIKISDDTSRLLCRFFPAPESRKMHAGKTRRSVPGDHQPLDTISPSAVDHRITLHITENGSCPCPNRKRLQKRASRQSGRSTTHIHFSNSVFAQFPLLSCTLISSAENRSTTPLVSIARSFRLLISQRDSLLSADRFRPSACFNSPLFQTKLP